MSTGYPGWLAVLISWSAITAAAAQDDERFSTGPVLTPLESHRDHDSRSLTGTPQRRPGPPDGSDVRANVETRDWQNETSISVNPLDPDHWVGVANDYRNGMPSIGWYTTFDGGATWVDGVMPLPPGFGFAGDPCVAFDVHGVPHIGGMQYGGSGYAVYHYSSRDGGLTWPDVHEVGKAVGYDKPQIASDLSRGPYRGAVCIAWIDFPDNVQVSVSYDGGATWSSPATISEATTTTPMGPDVAFAAGSEVYVMWVDPSNSTIWLDHSTDGGGTFGTDMLVGQFTSVPNPLPGSNFRIFDIFAMSADYTDGPYSGNVYIAYHTWNPNTTRADVRCTVSADRGTTWTDKGVHNDGGSATDQIMPGLFVDPHGNVNCCYYDRRLDPKNMRLWTWLSRSSDGGESWKDTVVSDVGWDHRFTEWRGTFIGDYIDCDASAHAVHPFWCDGRSGSLDVYADTVNLDFYTDKDELSVGTGGTVQFTINIGPNSGSQDYWVFGSLSGTSPGLSLGNGILLPLNFDSFLILTIVHANGGFLISTKGTLDATGSATAAITSGPLPPSLAGTVLYFATLVWSGAPTYATNPTVVTLVP
ncbi:MAG: sialidase family protein [Planctomycetota bacterium]